MIDEIINLIENSSSVENSLPWGHMPSTKYNRQNKKEKLRKILEGISGGEIVKMLKDVLTKEEINKLAKKHEQVRQINFYY